MKINKKLFRIIQSIVIITIFFIAFKELYKIFIDIDINLFKKYADKLTIVNLLIIAALGIISYIPLSFYDLITRKSIPIDLPVGKVYKYSWIASSVSSIVGFGGSSAILIKNYFYKNYVKDKSELTKENLKVVGLNLSGFSLICLIYSIWCFFTIKEFNIVFYASILFGLYIVGVLAFSTYKCIKDKNKEAYLITLKIMSISILEWITTILLIYGLIVILGIKVTLVQFAPVYIKAIIIAIISMVPGGAGTFDLTLLVGLKKFNVQSEQILLLLILYRISYYIVPLLIGVILYITELYNNTNSEIKQLMSRINSKIASTILMLTVYITGISLIFWMNIDISKIIDISSIFKINIFDLSIMLGFLLVVLASILNTRTRKVYYILVISFTLITLLIVTVIKSFTSYLVVIIGWLLIILSKNRFYKKGFIFTWKSAMKSICSVLILFTISLIINSFSYSQINSLDINSLDINSKEFDLKEIGLSEFDIEESKEYSEELKAYIEESKVYLEESKAYIKRIIISIFLGVIISISLVIILLNINKFNKFPKEKLNKEKIKEIISKHGGSSLAHYVFVGDKYVYINNTEDVFFQYQIISDKIVILGSPIGNKNSFFNAIREFYDLADLYGYTLVFTGVDISIFQELHDMGYDFMKLGQEAVVKLEDFSLAGNKNKSKRQAVSRIDKAGYTFSIEEPPFTDELFKELKDVSDEWLNGKKEKGFCVGYFDREYIEMDKIAIVRNAEGEIKAFATIMPMYDNKTLSVDLMRFKDIQLNGIMDFIFVNLFEYGKENGYELFNLGLVPLAEVGESKYSFIREKIAYQIFINGNFIYSFKGLKKFKDKYASDWNEKYIAYKKESSLVITCIQILKLLSQEKDTSDKK